jgi:predicted nucleotidyltransferase
MTEKSERCLALSRQVLAVFDAWPSVVATTIGGSVARGVADPCSDVDVFVYCDSLPSEEDSREVVSTLGGEWWTRSIRKHGEARRDTFGFGDERFDVEHVLVSRVESELDRILGTPDWEKQQFVGGFYDCIPVTGLEIANAWIDRVKAYPDGLQTVMINQHLIIEPLWVSYELHKWRDDWFYAQKSLMTAMERVMGILLGVNRLYKPSNGFKRIQRLTGAMKIAPERLGDRLRETFGLPTVEALNHLADIVEETFDLVEQHCPQIDVGPARNEFRGDSDSAKDEEGRKAGKGRGTVGPKAGE